MGQRAALYCRVSTADQSCDRQERDLRALAKRSGIEIVGVYKEKASSAKTQSHLGKARAFTDVYLSRARGTQASGPPAGSLPGYCSRFPRAQ